MAVYPYIWFKCQGTNAFHTHGCSHNDFAMGLRDLLRNDLTSFNFNMDLSSIEPWASYYADHTDLPRLRTGKVGGQVWIWYYFNFVCYKIQMCWKLLSFLVQFWSAYIGCSAQHEDAVQLFMEQVDVIKRLVKDNPDDMEFVTTSQGNFKFK